MLPAQYWPDQIIAGIAECASHYFFKGIQMIEASQMFVIGFVMHSTS